MNNNELILTNTILKEFKLINNIDNTLNDDLFLIYIKKAIQSILNLTNRYEFPIELKYIVIDLATDFYNDNKLFNSSTGEETSQSIKSISEEGRQVTFGNSNESTINSLLSSYINNKLNLRQKEIYRYRLLYKMKGV